ncbi:MAG: type II toxin-antitoxin system VapB family antitoxin, partial [Candidatus Omnitrophica bacterium]|nr:type II toxin-antitoxin system VapB family antitoxin [Candidatus Omnitrophota bacterium]
DDELVEKCLAATGLKTRRELIDYALREVLRHKNQRRLLELKGRVNWEDDLETMRRSRV